MQGGNGMKREGTDGYAGFLNAILRIHIYSTTPMINCKCFNDDLLVGGAMFDYKYRREHLKMSIASCARTVGCNLASIAFFCPHGITCPCWSFLLEPKGP